MKSNGQKMKKYMFILNYKEQLIACSYFSTFVWRFDIPRERRRNRETSFDIVRCNRRSTSPGRRNRVRCFSCVRRSWRRSSRRWKVFRLRSKSSFQTKNNSWTADAISRTRSKILRKYIKTFFFLQKLLSLRFQLNWVDLHLYFIRMKYNIEELTIKFKLDFYVINF
jgi:hypothetical protein